MAAEPRLCPPFAIKPRGLLKLTRQWLEKYQVLFYMAAIAAGLFAGTVYEDRAGFLVYLRLVPDIIFYE